ncbi:MAG: hypothetical protein NVSMB19_14340 [Vulcanimicrobiaceae bacterium]
MLAASAGAIAPEAVVTFDRLDGFAVLHSFGDVSGEAIVPRSFIRATVRTIGTLIGFGVAEYLTDAERARAQALAALLGNARALGANGVVKLRFDANEQSDGSTRVTAYGEAMLLDPAPGFTTLARP